MSGFQVPPEDFLKGAESRFGKFPAEEPKIQQISV
jgi:hypothetical protein